MEDAAIVDLYWARDEQALAETAAKFGAYCRKIADNILHSAHDAEECENDTWLAAWNSMPTNRPARLAPYLGRITRNLALDRFDRAAAHIRAFGEKYPLTIEMGRFFAAPCGTFLTGVADAKCNLGVNYAICDGGMHQVKYDGQLMGMQAPPLTLLRESADAPEPWMLCGSLCTTADVLVREAQLPPLRVGDVIALGRCGAYSVTEGVAVFLSRDMPRVALYRGGNFTLVRDRFATDALNTCRTPEDEA